MKKFLVIAFLALSATANAQVRFGMGLAVPVTGTDIVTEASVDASGVVHANKVLDSSPQLFLEIHRTWKMTKDMEIGPMFGVTPKIDFGMLSSDNTEHLIGAGFGLMLTKPVKDKKFLNFGAMWLITQPVEQLTPEFKDGFQAPRAFGLPILPVYVTKSVNRMVFYMTVSGLFQ